VANKIGGLEYFLSWMQIIPETDETLVLRSDFSDDSAWEAICSAVQEPVGIFRANVDILSDPNYEGITTEQILDFIPTNYEHSIIFIVDSVAISNPENPILVVDLYDDPGQSFRVIPSEIWGIENNLSLANVDFSEFAIAVDQDGIFRGFPRT
jgi:hypothetical protein